LVGTKGATFWRKRRGQKGEESTFLEEPRTKEKRNQYETDRLKMTSAEGKKGQNPQKGGESLSKNLEKMPAVPEKGAGCAAAREAIESRQKRRKPKGRKLGKRTILEKEKVPPDGKQIEKFPLYKSKFYHYGERKGTGVREENRGSVEEETRPRGSKRVLNHPPQVRKKRTSLMSCGGTRRSETDPKLQREEGFEKSRGGKKQ